MLGRTDAGTDFRASLPVRRQLLHLLPPSPSHPSDLTPPPPLCIHVVLCSAAACSLISTNKFILDTNYSSATSGGAVGRSNERQQSPHHRGPPPPPPSFLVGAISDRTTMDLRFLFFPRFFYSLLSTGLKVASSKGGEQGGSGAREGQGALRGRGDSFFRLYRGLRGVEEEEVPPGDSASRASLER